MRRSILRIDEEKCDGCGVCVPACAEGAIQIIDGKARLVSDVYCDGLGACLGECPQDAITIQEREAESFDAEAVQRHLQDSRNEADEGAGRAQPVSSGCPGAAVQVLERLSSTDSPQTEPSEAQLGNWPVQIMLAPVKAPHLDGARLLIAGDCVPFAFADFHRKLLAGRTLLIGCPKLDDADLYHRKLAQIFAQNDIHSVQVVHMEVPCCSGLHHLVREALSDSGKSLPASVVEIGIHGDILNIGELDTGKEGD